MNAHVTLADVGASLDDARSRVALTLAARHRDRLARIGSGVDKRRPYIGAWRRFIS